MLGNTDVIWGTVFLAGKWALIALFYGALFVIVRAVRREMTMRLESPLPLPAAMGGRLRVLDPGTDPVLGVNQLLPLPNRGIVGSEPDKLDHNDLLLRDQYVSGRHALLSWDGARWWVEDLGSRNGTYVENERCPAHEPHPLPPGSRLQIGNAIFELLV